MLTESDIHVVSCDTAHNAVQTEVKKIDLEQNDPILLHEGQSAVI